MDTGRLLPASCAGCVCCRFASVHMLGQLQPSRVNCNYCLQQAQVWSEWGSLLPPGGVSRARLDQMAPGRSLLAS